MGQLFSSGLRNPISLVARQRRYRYHAGHLISKEEDSMAEGKVHVEIVYCVV